MEFKEHLKESERFLSGKFHYDEKDQGENALRNTVERFLAASDKLDQYKKLKYYGRELSPELTKEEHQMSVQQFERAPEDGAEKLLHAAIGIATESAELLEVLYKSKWNGEQFDVFNCKEEIGDLFFFFSIIFRELDLDLNEILANNIKKLDKRYDKEFSEEAANNRDLKAEREILEGK